MWTRGKTALSCSRPRDMHFPPAVKLPRPSRRGLGAMAIKCGRDYGAFQQSRGGNLVSESVQRRLTAILAADVAGYSRLMGLDEAGTVRTLHEHRAAVD